MAGTPQNSKGCAQQPNLFTQRDQRALSLFAEGWLWRTEQIHTFKTVLQSVPMGISAKVICGKVQAALLEGNVKKTFDQASARLSPQGGAACTCTTSPLLPGVLKRELCRCVTSTTGS